MRNVHVVGRADPATLEVRVDECPLAAKKSSLGPGGKVTPEPFELVLAGLGGCTTNSMIDHAIRNGWNLGTVHVELALHGQAPWHAIGRRIWVDGNLNASQLASLLDAADRSPVAMVLRPTVYIQSSISHAIAVTLGSTKL